jgi:hypothetical protein
VGNADPRDPLVSPVFGDYTGMTPMFLLCGTSEIVSSDAIRVAASARSQGVDVTLLVMDGMWHVPIGNGSGIPELQLTFDEMIKFFKENLMISNGSYTKKGYKESTFDDEKESVKVNALNFVRAETDMTMVRYVKKGAFGKFMHIRQPTPLDKQGIIRMNRDTQYSFAVFDLTEPVTIFKPESGDRLMSLSTSNQDHSISNAIYNAGEYTFTKESIGSRYMFVGIRTQGNPSDPEDIKKANELQDQIIVKQKDIGTFEVPNWDLVSLTKVRDAINVLASTMENTDGFFGDKSKLNPIMHLMGTAYGWGGNPKENAMYIGVVPEENDGKVAYTLHVKDVPVDAFWSITVYNSKGFMEPNDRNVVSINSSMAISNADGSFTIHFGGTADAVNQIPIMEGWNYLVRLYRPRKELLDGTWQFPAPMKVE